MHECGKSYEDTMKKILIIGAGFLQDFVIRKAKSMGYMTYAVDADSNAVGFRHADKHEVINIVDENACLAYAKKENIDGVLTAATDFGVLTAAYIAREMNLPGLNYESASLIKNKYRVRKRLYEAHVDDTEQAYEVNGDTDISDLCGKLAFPVMVKPCDGSGSRGAARVNEPAQLEAACINAMASSITHRAEVETFVIGREYGAESLVINGEVHVLGIMRKWMTNPPYYAELGHAIPTDLPAEVEAKAVKCVEKALKALGVNIGSVNMDMLITDDGKVHIVDVGARMGGNMIGPCIIPYGTGVDYMANMLRAAVGDKVDFTPKGHGAVATRLLAFEHDTVVKHLPDFEALEKEYGVEIYHHMEKGQKIYKYRTNLDGLGYVVARDDSVDEAVRKAENVLKVITDCLR